MFRNTNVPKNNNNNIKIKNIIKNNKKHGL